MRASQNAARLSPVFNISEGESLPGCAGRAKRPAEPRVVLNQGATRDRGSPGTALPTSFSIGVHRCPSVVNPRSVCLKKVGANVRPSVFRAEMSAICLSPQNLRQHVGQNSAGPVVIDFHGRVESDDHRVFFDGAIGFFYLQSHFFPGFDSVVEAGD